MATPRNPYVAGNPVGDSPAFIGRADVLREVGRVLLERKIKPSQRFVDFAGARCGVTAASLSVGTYGGDLPKGAKDAEVFAKWSEGLRDWLPSVLDGVGMGIGWTNSLRLGDRKWRSAAHRCE